MAQAMLHLDSLGWLLVDIAWKSTVLLLVAHGVDRLFLRRRPLISDTLWRSTILILLALPLWCSVLPRFELSHVGSPIFAGVTNGPAVDGDPHTTGPESTAALTTVPVSSAEYEEVLAASGGASKESDRSTQMVTFVILAYVGITIAFAIRLGFSLLAVQRMLRESTPVTSEEWCERLTTWKAQLGIRRAVEIRRSQRVVVPLTVGWIRPVVFLPWSVADSADRYVLNAVLLHELTHIARDDYPFHLMSKIAECMFWYNPFVWLTVRRLGQVRETICDGYCISRLEDRESYVGVLLLFATALSQRLTAPLGLAMARTCRLERRLSDLATQVVRNYSFGRWARFAAASLALALSGVISMVAVGDDTTEKPATVDEIIAALKLKEESLETLQAVYVCQSEFNFVKPGTKGPPEHLIEDDAVSMTRKAEVSWEVIRDGRGRMEAALKRTNVRRDGTKVDRDEKIVSTFNGGTGRWLETRKAANGSSERAVGRATEKFQRTNDSPFDMTTQHLGAPVSKLLVDGKARLVGTEQWEGRPVVILEVSPVTVRQDYIYQQRFWIDIDRATAVRRQSFVQCGAGMPRGLHYQVDAKEYSEVSAGIWLPKVVDVLNYHVSKEGQDFLVAKEHYEVTNWMANEKIDSTRFNLEYPKGTLDTDRPGPGEPVPTRSW